LLATGNWKLAAVVWEIHHSLTCGKHSRNNFNIEFSWQNPARLRSLVLGAGPPQVMMHFPAGSYEALGDTAVVAASRSLIFVVEDDGDIARLISHNLQAAGFDVQSFVSGGSVVSEALREMPSLVLLDVMLPGADGFELCRQIRQTPTLSSTPIIFLTAKTAEADRVKGLEMGGDDYITKPFSPRELVARVRSVLRGLRHPSETPEVLRLGDLTIDASSMTVLAQGRAVLTTVREFRLLEYLASHCGRVLTRDQLLDAVWKETPFVTPRSIDVYVRRLREKIEPDPRHPKYLKTLRGIGYRFESPR
jgi:two-component system phosphate regulon response regulator PhoB